MADGGNGELKLKNGSKSKCILWESKWAKVKEGCPGLLFSAFHLPLLKNTTFSEFVFRNVDQWAHVPFIKCGDTGREYSYGEVYGKSKSFAATLIQDGLKRNDVICILLPNLAEYPIVAHGIIQAGCVFSPINPNSTKDEIVNQVRNCSAKLLITTGDLAPLAQLVRDCCPSLTQTTIVVETGRPPPDCRSFFQLVETDWSGLKLLQGADIDTTNYSCLLAYSSGTTGAPKGVEHTHASYLHNLRQLTHPDFCQAKLLENVATRDRYVSVIPFFHVYGFLQVLSVAMCRGAYLYSLTKFQPNTFVKALHEQKPTIVPLVTPLINFLAQDASATRDLLSECRGIITAAAPVGLELTEKFRAKFGSHIFFQEGYGMTEIGWSHSIPNGVENEAIGSVGVMLPGNACKTVDEATGGILGPNQHGELCFKTGGAEMKGYFGNEEATRNTVDSEGWVHTGDKGYYDERGFFYIVDRYKDLIKVKGLQVAPSELENILRQHADIEDVAVVGVTHPRLGEAPRAYVVRARDSLTKDEIHAFLEPQLASYKQLAGGIQFIPAIPKTASGKILKRLLVADYQNEIQ